VTERERDLILALSDERDGWEQRLVNNWQAGWNAAVAALGDQFEAGFIAGLVAYKQAQHSQALDVIAEINRWGPDGREHFGDPRPGDFLGEKGS
jgi:hypothetical protein